jgi:DNA-directed RNA polymerase specialized sigma24 family protein
MPDPRNDEQLIADYYAGDENALEVLYNRYYTRCLGFLYNKSKFRADDYLEDVRGEIIKITLTIIRKKEFKIEGEGSFAAWFYRVALLECMSAFRKHLKDKPSVSQAFPDCKGPFPDDKIISMVCSDEKDIQAKRIRLARAFKHLTPKEIRALILSVKIPYGDIIKMPEFAEYNEHSFAEYVYNIKKKIREAEDDTE